MKNFLFTALAVLMATSLFAQKRALTVDDFDTWVRVSKGQISNNGKWVAYEKKPFKGDGQLLFVNTANKKRHVSDRSKSAKFAGKTAFVAYRIVPQADSVRALKLKKAKKSKMPKDSLGILALNTGERYLFPRLLSFVVSENNDEWIAMLQEKGKKKNKKKDEDKKKDKKEGKKKEKKAKAKKKDKNVPKVYTLLLFNTKKQDTIRVENVSEVSFAKHGRSIVYAVQQNDSLTQATVYLFDTKSAKTTPVFKKSGVVKKITLAEENNTFAFLHSADTIKNKVYSLYFSNEAKLIKKPLLSIGNKALPNGWAVSEHGNLNFSRDGSKLYFGTAPAPKPETKDTLLDSEKVKVDIWHWEDLRLQPQQLLRKKRDTKRSYRAVYHTAKNKIVQLNTEQFSRLNTYNFGNANWGIISDSKPYMLQRSWTFDGGSDQYFLNLLTGKKKLLKKGALSRSAISPNGKYVAYYNAAEKQWSTVDTKTAKATKHNIAENLFDEEHDYPETVSPYGSIGWTADNMLWIYDRYDIWSIDPTGKQPASNVTFGFGRKNKLRLRYIWLDEESSVVVAKDAIFSAFNETNKEAGYYKLAKRSLTKQISGPYRFSHPRKAKDSDLVLWRKSNFKEYSDYYVSSTKFDTPVKVSNANPQQKDFLWGSVELFKWEVNGKEEEGLLYKPENFDPNKKYPVVVYFYRLYSNLLHRHIIPKQSRSTINPTFYVSNDYIVFIPNVRFEIGHPGKSALRHITSGTEALAKNSFIDKDKIGIQGQSWGGYQVAYMVTETNMFKAAWAGAPVSNMTSAYGGIRWGSGMSRMFQYEKTQSRIGTTLWEKPELYIENSPVFHAPKINTPLAIMHNDNDGAVPWYQGIELFVAMRRLGKPAWLLNYNRQPHNLKEYTPNGKDLSIRLMQFFDHYLKGKPAPEWMSHGVRAVEKGKNLGYDVKQK